MIGRLKEVNKATLAARRAFPMRSMRKSGFLQGDAIEKGDNLVRGTGFPQPRENSEDAVIVRLKTEIGHWSCPRRSGHQAG